MLKKMKNSLLLQLIAFAALILFFLTAAFVITREYSGQMLRDRTIELNDRLLQQTESKIIKFYETVNDVATAMVYTPAVYEYFSMDPVTRVMMSEEIGAIFSNTVLLEGSIAGIYLYDTGLNQIAEMGKNIAHQSLADHLRQKLEFGDKFFMKQNGVGFYPAYFPVYDLNNQKYGIETGMCMMILKADSLKELLEDSQVTVNTRIYLLDSKNHVLASRGDTETENLSGEMLVSSKEYFTRVQEVGGYGWRIVSRIPTGEMAVSSEESGKFVAIAYVLAGLLLVLFVYFIYRRMVEPVHQMDQFIREIVENPGKRMEVRREDELGIVALNLNRMLDTQQKMNLEMQYSQKKMYEAELAKKQLQVLAYRNQINPHFLYNTFECICSMALYYEVEDIAELTMALSKVFRFAVKGSNVVTVEEEVSYIREYAKIIDYRFGGTIEVHISMDEEVRNNRIIKLMLQPLVENAVFHGLEQKMDDREVHVVIRKQWADHIVFRVEDNGCGIPEEKLNSLRAGLEEPNEGKKGIGIANIYQRLKLFYGDDTVFLIDSRIDKGTRITIVVPDHVEEGGN